MRYYKIALAAGILSIICFTSSFCFFRISQVEAEYNQNRYQAVIKMRSETKTYEDKIVTLKEYGKEIMAISNEGKTKVDYDITLHYNNIDALYSQIISTYEQGLFFLESAVIESGASGIRLAVKGFKMGETSDEN
ncbi:MAG TPA: hypothetical protein ENN05_02530 [Deltaproteobacteria bacterium]|nr:hypothetical protein [Deltaproteobacteria bacterium]